MSNEASIKEIARDDYVSGHKRDLDMLKWHATPYKWNDPEHRGDYSQEDLERWYREGFQAAKQEEQDKGTIVFLADELIRQMDDADEWYGSSFDGPRALVERIKQAALTEKKVDKT